MIFAVQRFIFGFLLVCSVAVLVTGCTNRPAGERWKFASNQPELVAKPMDYIYQPMVKPDGSLSDAETRKLMMFLKKSGMRVSDQLIVQASSSYQGENAGQWITYWLEGQKLNAVLKAGALDVFENSDGETGSNSNEFPVQIVLRKYALSVPHCERNMSSHITSVTSVTRSTLGCANVANLGHMVANPSHVANGSDPGLVDGEHAASGVYDYWNGKTKPLIVDQFDVLSNGTGEE